MMHTIRSTGRVCLALALTLTLCAAPVAWAADGPSPQHGSWLTQLWSLVTAWVAPAESGPTADPSGLETSTGDATPQPWAPMPLDPATTNPSSENDDSGPTMDPNG